MVAGQPGFQVVGVASTGAQALEAVRTTRPDLVLLDIYLPDMTGLEVLKRLRENAGSAVDVIVISAARDLDTLRRALHGGVFQYLVKPFEIESLRQRLGEYAAHRADSPSSPRCARTTWTASSGPGGARGTSLPKGISPETIDLVLKALEGAEEDGLSAMER